MSESPSPINSRDASGLPVEASLDAAERSLADALRVSFLILKLAMLLLVVLYLLSGFFNVREQEMAVRLRFGRIVGERGEQVLSPGGPYFSWPYPFEQVVTVPSSPQQLDLNTSFWYETDVSHAGVSASDLQSLVGPLNPEKDGSLLTGDAEVVHARWSVIYTVDDPIGYLTRVRDGGFAERLIRVVTEQSVVNAVAQMTADRLIRSQDVSVARLRAQELLDALGSGIRITSLTVKDPVYPLPVRVAVQEVLNAESVRARLIEEAQEQWGRILVGAAGEAFEPLLTLVESYELASQSGIDGERLVVLEERLDRCFSGLGIGLDGGVIPIGGEVAQLIHDAKTYRTEVISRIRGEADYFNRLLPEYRANPRIVRSRLWEDAKERILTGDVETMYLPRGQAYLELNRDPRVQQERERQKLLEEDPSHSR